MCAMSAAPPPPKAVAEVCLVRGVPPVVASGRAATCQSAIRSLG